MRCLTYSKALFTRVYEVRTVSADKTLGTMIYSMLRSTQILEGFAELGWIRHPDVSSALVVASLQKEGKSVKEAVKSTKQEVAQVKTNKSNIKSLQTELQNLRTRNPNLNA